MKRNIDISLTQDKTSDADSADNRPVASRTRRLSSVSNDGHIPIAPLDQNSLTNVDAGAGNLLQNHGSTKTYRNQHRRDYNELVNGHDHSMNIMVKRLARAHCKPDTDRSDDDNQLLIAQKHLLPAALVYLKRKQEKQTLKQRLEETEEPQEVIKVKGETLADLIRDSRHVVIYTGAGISTSASIPDYRGPNGLWTQIRRTGSFSMTKVFKDLSKAKPTFTHMAINELCKRKIVKHVVSQNFDGLHLRSGISQNHLSEIHGNMFIEICPTCEKQYYRTADVTQKTVRFRHKTGRQCHTCSGPNNNLLDTIVLYGERSRSKWPMNWERASKAAKNADLIICMGSSLKTLRRYGCLWPKSISVSASLKANSRHDTKLVIINLQHTSKDKNAVLKINGKCDLVMEHVMRHLNIDVPSYEISSDPLQTLAIPFSKLELVKLERNLLFGTQACNETIAKADTEARGSRNVEIKRELDDGQETNEMSVDRCSPSLFVSEMTDDPDKRRLRMRIRALTPS